MCGRFVLKQNLAEICAAFSATSALFDTEPTYNAAPEGELPIVIRNRVGAGTWGWPVVPGMPPIINIRSETMAEKPLFAESVQAGRRCVIPASGFYEWDVSGQPFYVESPAAPLLGLCGLWTRDPDQTVRFAIVTRPAIPQLATIHERMPAVGTPDAMQAWLAQGIVPPVPALSSHAVGPEVNKASNNSPDLIAPIGPAPQGHLFAAS